MLEKHPRGKPEVLQLPDSFSLFFVCSADAQVVLGGVMQAWGVKPNQLSFNTIMDAYAREGNVNNVVKIYNFMQVRAEPQYA